MKQVTIKDIAREARSEERRVGKECRSAYVTGVLTCALPI